MTTPRRRRLLLGVLGIVTVVVSSACTGTQSHFPDAVTKQARETRSLYYVVFILAGIVFVGVELAIVYVAIRYRRRRDDDGSLPPQVHGNNVAELIWFLIPMVVVGILFFMQERTLRRVDAREARSDVRIEVSGFQWQWNFKYPDLAFTVRGRTDAPPEMVIPVNENIHVDLRAVDVIHSFYVPDFLFKRDLVPGRDNAFDFTAEKEGTFAAQCAEFCGLLHSRMTFTVRVVDRIEYDAWVVGQQDAERRRFESCAVPSTKERVVAVGIDFDKDCLSFVPAQPLQIEFVNNDGGIAHNVAIYRDETLADTLFPGAIFNGVETRTYDTPPLEEGAFYFRCDVHPVMSGIIQVKAP